MKVLGAANDPRVGFGLVLELSIYGSLYDKLEDRTNVLAWELRVQLLLDVAKGVSALHANPNHQIVAELRNKAEIDQSDKTVKDLVWLLYETSILTSGFSLDEPQNFASRIHRMIKLGLSIFDDDKAEDDDLPPLDDAAAEARPLKVSAEVLEQLRRPPEH